MRLRGGLLLLLSLLLPGAVLQAAGTLQGIKTSVDSQGTTLLLRLPTPVTYSPSQVGPRLYLIDVTGVTTDRPADGQLVESPLVSGYRVFSYQGADNQPHLGLELTLKEDAQVLPYAVPEGLEIRVQRAGAASGAAPAPAPVPVPAATPAPVASALPPAAAPAQHPAAPASTFSLREVSVIQPEGAAGLEVEIFTDGEPAYETHRLRSPDRLVVDLSNTVNRIRQTNLAVNTSPLKAVRIGQFRNQPPVARVVMDLNFHVPFEIRRQSSGQSSGLVVSLGSRPAESAGAQPLPVEASTEPVLLASNNLSGMTAPLVPAAATSALSPGPLVTETPRLTVPVAAAPILLAQQFAGSATPPQGQQPVYTGEPISLNLKDVDLKDFFRLMHEVSGLNVVLDPNVAGNVTIVLDEVPWDQAMDVVLHNNGLEARTMGNVVRVARISTLEAEAKAQLAKAQAEALREEQGQPRETVTRTLSYARAADLVTPLKRFLSARGDLVPDARTNTLIITDIPTNIASIDRLIGNLDRKTEQVEIEARILAASRSFARDIGSQLAASAASGNVTLGGTGQVGVSPINRGTVPPLFIGTPPDPPAPGELPEFANLAQPLAVNLGAVGATSGMSFLLTGGNFALDQIITAAESRGLGKLLSRPKVITQNNVEATVQQGVRIPIQTNVNNTITVQFVNVVLRLTVTPQITSDGTIFLQTDIENTTINPGIPRILGVPALNTQAATTNVLVSDGGTVFFGGIIQTDNNLTEQQVPLLGSIPLLGNLFKRKATSSTTNELLFFITPKITQS